MDGCQTPLLCDVIGQRWHPVFHAKLLQALSAVQLLRVQFVCEGRGVGGRTGWQEITGACHLPFLFFSLESCAHIAAPQHVNHEDEETLRVPKRETLCFVFVTSVVDRQFDVCVCVCVHVCVCVRARARACLPACLPTYLPTCPPTCPPLLVCQLAVFVRLFGSVCLCFVSFSVPWVSVHNFTCVCVCVCVRLSEWEWERVCVCVH